ncbi:MAG TPA: hypothetical protein VGP48_02555 [Stellaceae bacterium]|jgi:hypothetical protein|nr:hypothetical protein [Stellaceae bacterium]
MPPQAPAPAPTRAGRGGEAASLKLIDLHRIDRAAKANAKAGDLTTRLQTTATQPVPSERPAAAARGAPPPMPQLPPLPEAPAEPVRHHADVSDILALEPGPDPLRHFPDRLVAADVATYIVSAPEPLPEPETVRPAPLPYDDLRSAEELIDYWDDLRDGRELPFFASLDRTRIAISWPDSLMVTFSGADAAATPQIARLSRLTGGVEYSSMVTEWILGCSRQVARIGKAMEHEQKFPGSHGGTKSYRMLLLPFATAIGKSDHILCHLSSAI